MNDKRINFLSEKLFNGTITQDERSELESWYADMGDGVVQIDRYSDKKKFSQNLFSLISEKAGLSQRKNQSVFKYAAIAASLMVGMSIAGYFLLKSPVQNIVTASGQMVSEVVPGRNKALLKLSNGQVVDLNEANEGQLSTGGREVIHKTSTGQIAYRPHAGSKEDLGYNTLTTPRGGKFNIQLPDGSLAMLDAGSSITYPAQFGTRERSVAITGQIYFEVVHRSAQPFIVKAGNQIIKDIGTHFNISAYSDEKTVRTTLEEGAVSVTQSGNTVFLKPGQAAVSGIGAARPQIEVADIEETLAWKNGYFRFHNEPIESIMPKISRWYNVDIKYTGRLPSDGFNGTISRSKSIEKVLNMLQRTGIIHFKVEGRSVTVLP
jgi:transmembrane sensor